MSRQLRDLSEGVILDMLAAEEDVPLVNGRTITEAGETYLESVARAELSERARPINWDDMGSSAKDLWAERQLRSIRKSYLRG